MGKKFRTRAGGEGRESSIKVADVRSIVLGQGGGWQGEGAARNVRKKADKKRTIDALPALTKRSFENEHKSFICSSGEQETLSEEKKKGQRGGAFADGSEKKSAAGMYIHEPCYS